MNSGEGTVPTGMLAAAAATFRRDVVLAFRRPGQMLQPVVFFLIVLMVRGADLAAWLI